MLSSVPVFILCVIRTLAWYACAWGPRFSIALAESVAFFGGAILLRVLTKDPPFEPQAASPFTRVFFFYGFGGHNGGVGDFSFKRGSGARPA